MARYIDADEYRKRLEMICGDGYTKQVIDIFIDWFMSIAESTESADVAPVIHAHWTITYESTAGVTDAKCSNCGFESLAYENDVHTDENCNYCPCCGAKMDEEVNDA